MGLWYRSERTVWARKIQEGFWHNCYHWDPHPVQVLRQPLPPPTTQMPNFPWTDHENLHQYLSCSGCVCWSIGDQTTAAHKDPIGLGHHVLFYQVSFDLGVIFKNLPPACHPIPEVFPLSRVDLLGRWSAGKNWQNLLHCSVTNLQNKSGYNSVWGKEMLFPF